MVGQKPFAYFWLGRHSGFSKVRRRKGATNRSRYRSNGYVRKKSVQIPLHDKKNGAIYLPDTCFAFLTDSPPDGSKHWLSYRGLLH